MNPVITPKRFWTGLLALLIVLASVIGIFLPTCLQTEVEPPGIEGSGPSGMIDISEGSTDPPGSGGWTEVDDAGGILTVKTPYRVRWTDMDRSEAVLYNNDLGVDAVTGNFTHYLTVGFDELTGANAYSTFWAVTNKVDDAYALRVGLDPGANDVEYLTFNYWAGDLRIEEGETDGTNTNNDAYTLPSAYDFRALYVTISRSGTTFSCAIYSTPSRDTTPIDTLTITLSEAPGSYRYLFLAQSYDSDGASAAHKLNGFSSELFIDETPPNLFAESNRAEPFPYTNEDGFENGDYTTGNETWTRTQNAPSTLAVDGNSEITGNYSIKVDANDNSDDSNLRFTSSAAFRESAMVEFKFKIDANGFANGGTSQIGGVFSSNSSDAMMLEVRNQGGVYYPRMMLYDSSATTYVRGTQTDFAISLDTVYTATLVYNSDATSGTGTLSIDHVIVDSAIRFGLTSFDSGRIGYFGGGNDYKYGTRFADDFKLMKGQTFFPGIARGGTDDGSLVLITRTGVLHAGDYGSEIDIFFSTDNGGNWTWVYGVAANATIDLRKAFITWDAAGSGGNGSWWIAQYYLVSSDATFPRTKIYEMTSFDPSADTPDITPIITERYDSWDDDTKKALITLTRIIDGDDIIIGLHYFDTDDQAGTNVVKSGRFSTGNYTVWNEETIAEYGDVAAHPLVSEPQQWDTSTGRSTSVRVDTDPCCSNQMRRSDYSGGSWGNLTDPGPDWEGRAAWPRAFPFGNVTYWIARDGQPTTQLSWGTGIIKSTLDTMQFMGEKWWVGYAETGNGDIDATAVGGGTLYLDVVFDTGHAFYSRMETDMVLHSVTTVAADAIASTSANLKGTIDSLGDSGELTSYGWVYEIAVNGAPAVPEWDEAPDEAANWDLSVVVSGSTYSVGPYNSLVEGLAPDTKYYFAFGGYSVEFKVWVYNEVSSFETTPGIRPNPMIGPDPFA